MQPAPWSPPPWTVPLRCAGERNGACRWLRPDTMSLDAPIRAVRMSRRPGEARATAEPGYCGLPDPVTGEPHTALTAFRQRQVLAGQGGGTAGPMDPERPGLAFWRRRQRAEAEAREARAAALEAEARQAEALVAKAAAEQQAAAEREAAQARTAQAERAAEQQVAGARQERDEAVSAAESRAAEAESRAGTAGQDGAGRGRLPRRPARSTARLNCRSSTPTMTRRPGRPPEDNPDAQRGANAPGESERRAPASAALLSGRRRGRCHGRELSPQCPADPFCLPSRIPVTARTTSTASRWLRWT